MSRRYIFSSESVTEGHPDKVCDTISDSILDACLEQDPLSRVACETLAKGNLVVLAGEITSNANVDFEERVRTAIRDIGYVNGDCAFHADTCRVIWEMSEQSRDIKQGVDEAPADGKAPAEQGAERHAGRLCATLHSHGPARAEGLPPGGTASAAGRLDQCFAVCPASPPIPA